MTVTDDSSRFGENFDFTSPAVLENGVPVEQFAELRRTSPVWWNHQPRGRRSSVTTGIGSSPNMLTSNRFRATVRCGPPTPKAR